MKSLVEQELRALVENVRSDKDPMVTYFHVLHWFERSDRLLAWPVSKESIQNSMTLYRSDAHG